MSTEPVSSEDTGPAVARGPAGLCLGCNYPLRGLSEPRCPECGRAFDPADPKTMNMGGRIGRLGRLLARPIGWPLLLLALLGMAGVLYQSRWPVGGLLFSRIDVTYYRAYARLPWKPYPGSIDDRVYTTALTLWMLVAAAWVLRTAGRWAAIRLYRVPKPQRLGQGRRQAAMVLLLGLTLAAVGYGWPYRVARVWGEAKLFPLPGTLVGGGGSSRTLFGPAPPACPLPLNEAEQAAVLRAGVIQLGSPEQRRDGLKRLIEVEPGLARDVLTLAAPREKDPILRALELRLLGLCRGDRPGDWPDRVLVPGLNDPSPVVRAGAADGLGVHYGPAYPVLLSSDPYVDCPDLATTDGNIPLAPLLLANLLPSPPSAAAAGPPPGVREALEKTMLNGTDSEERQAAARALLPWPPDGYQLRLAEWGVWVTGADGPPGAPGVGMAGRQVDAIPPFVHQTGNSVKELSDRIAMPTFITKPVVHLTADRPLAVELEVRIEDGRPWFAYPKPDDFTMVLGGSGVPTRAQTQPGGPWQTFASPLLALDATGEARGLAPLTGLREGYPWLTPAHRIYSWGSGFGPGPEISSVGLRWQSLIVSPRKLEWMAPPQVGTGAENDRYRWWEKLREVPCAWVSSRGEAERFVYYDGPTALKCPMAVEAEGQPPAVLRFLPNAFWRGPDWPPSGSGRRVYSPPLRAVDVDEGMFGRRAPRGAAAWTSGRDAERAERDPGRGRSGLFIRVAGGQVKGRVMAVPSVDEAYRKVQPEAKPVRIDSGEVLEGPAVEARLRAMLADAGLLPAEAEGLLAAWRDSFFETEGARFLLLLTPDEYNTMCPLSVRPRPTQLVRVGLVLTELGEPKKGDGAGSRGGG